MECAWRAVFLDCFRSSRMEWAWTEGQNMFSFCFLFFLYLFLVFFVFLGFFWFFTVFFLGFLSFP